jgi:hypothetical protein
LSRRHTTTIAQGSVTTSALISLFQVVAMAKYSGRQFYNGLFLRLDAVFDSYFADPSFDQGKI